MSSTHDHEDRDGYWLTDPIGGGQPIPDKVSMVMSRSKSKVYYCFIKLSGKIAAFIITALFYRTHWGNLSKAKNRNLEHTA